MTDSVFSKFDHVGVVVKDLDKAINYYQSLGIGPFENLEVDKLLSDKMMYGKPTDYKLKAAIAQIGTIKFELIEPVADAPLWEEFLKKGEGINHLAFLVDDCGKATAELVSKGFKVVQSTNLTGGGSCAFFDTSKVGGIILELIQW